MKRDDYLAGENRAWNIKYDFGYDLDKRPATTSCLIFVSFSFSILHCSPDFFLSSTSLDRSLPVLSIYSHIFLCPSCLAYARWPFVLSCSLPAADKDLYTIRKTGEHLMAVIKPANKTKVFRNILLPLYI